MREIESDTRKKKITISLSDKTLQLVEELITTTDADTISEAFRNAIRVHHYLIKATNSHATLVIKTESGEEIVPVIMFAP